MSDDQPEWRPDPTGKHDHRYWDGRQWTDHVADAGVAGEDPYEPPVAATSDPEPTAEPEAVVSADAPTAITPVAGDDTTQYPTAPAAAPYPPPPAYVPPTPVATGASHEEKGRRRLIIGGAILAVAALAVIAFLALGGDDDEPTDPLANGSVPTTEDTGGDDGDGGDGGGESLEDLRDACASGDFAACDSLYFAAEAGSDLEGFGSTCGGTAPPQSGACEVTNGGEDVPVGGFDPDDLDDIYQDAFESMGLTEDQAECLTDHIIDAIDSGDIDEDQALEGYLSFLEDCDISLEDIGAN
jgi:hypothetical protein